MHEMKKEQSREQEMRRSGRLEQSVVDLREQVAFSLSTHQAVALCNAIFTMQSISDLDLSPFLSALTSK